jgi:hypothetical protein
MTSCFFSFSSITGDFEFLGVHHGRRSMSTRLNVKDLRLASAVMLNCDFYLASLRLISNRDGHVPPTVCVPIGFFGLILVSPAVLREWLATFEPSFVRASTSRLHKSSFESVRSAVGRLAIATTSWR